MKKKKGSDEIKSDCITSFSSGTGIAGIVGYGYKALFSDVVGLGLSATVWSAMLFAVAYYYIYLKGLCSVETNMQEIEEVAIEDGASAVSESSQLVNNDDESSDNINPLRGRKIYRESSSSALEMVNTIGLQHTNTMQQSLTPDSTATPHNLTSVERFKLVLVLSAIYDSFVYCVRGRVHVTSGCLVSLIGFPISSSNSRAQFYHYSNGLINPGSFCLDLVAKCGLLVCPFCG